MWEECLRRGRGVPRRRVSLQRLLPGLPRVRGPPEGLLSGNTSVVLREVETPPPVAQRLVDGPTLTETVGKVIASPFAGSRGRSGVDKEKLFRTSDTISVRGTGVSRGAPRPAGSFLSRGRTVETYGGGPPRLESAEGVCCRGFSRT